LQIIFKKIRYKNIISVGNNFLEIDFIKNKNTLFVGENGSGKSTLLDALSFVAFNKPYRKINKPQLINSINQKNLLVELELESGNNSYIIRRGMKPNIFEIYKNNELLNQNASIKDYQQELEKNVLKMNYKTFTQIVILGSTTFIPFMQLTPQQKREVIEDLLDLEIFTIMNTLLRGKLSENKENQKDAAYNIKLTEEKISLEEDHMKKMVINHTEMINEKKDKVKKYKSDIDEIEEKNNEYNKAIEELKQSITKKSRYEKMSSELSTIYEKMIIKLNKIKKDIEFFNNHDNCPMCRQEMKVEFKKSILEKRHEQHTSTSEALKELNAEKEKVMNVISTILDITKKITNYNNDISINNNLISSYLKFISQIEEEISSLNKKVDDVKLDKNTITQLKKDREIGFKRKTELTEEYNIYKVGIELLKDNGIKSKIIKQYIPIMNKLMNHYLQQLGFFVKFEIDENFNEKIKSRFRDEFSYESFSEGEKLRIDLSLLFCWRTIAKLRNSVNTNLLILDEICDSSLDNNGTEEFLKILENLTGDTNTIVISHKGDILSDKFNHTVKFEKIGNFTKMSI
jgi:DNA repair exonuclease SbcCD ATPase subunit